MYMVMSCQTILRFLFQIQYVQIDDLEMQHCVDTPDFGRALYSTIGKVLGPEGNQSIRKPETRM